jgi:hypothetical protein
MGLTAHGETLNYLIGSTSTSLPALSWNVIVILPVSTSLSRSAPGPWTSLSKSSGAVGATYKFVFFISSIK